MGVQQGTAAFPYKPFCTIFSPVYTVFLKMKKSFTNHSAVQPRLITPLQWKKH
jgi:hypothetical protein